MAIRKYIKYIHNVDLECFTVKKVCKATVVNITFIAAAAASK